MGATWDHVADERRCLADLVDDLGPEELATQSLCDAWTVRDVVAHLSLALQLRPLVAARAAVQARGSVDRTLQVLTARAAAEHTTAELAALLRERAAGHFRSPGLGAAGPLTDLVVHGVDLRLPIGRDHEVPPDALRAALDFSVSARATSAFTRRGVAKGLRLVAPDAGWAHGTGPTAEGPGRLLAAALCGRPAALDHLTGDGVAVLAARIA